MRMAWPVVVVGDPDDTVGGQTSPRCHISCAFVDRKSMLGVLVDGENVIFKVDIRKRKLYYHCCEHIF
ncbi:hypothetical protein E2562_030298 [Oryza meyeriana var. granulata]|uniref:Uncharacterized protein n=1 Tax=Oryza meyeriana var. granulata TaxID=110450 RepID=A0A6G1EZR3_9ORYZ|nr:hypothetical protein E2562_030298 [Oryza meyeriana var. granulata]